MPSPYFLLFELIIYIQFALCLRHAFKGGTANLLKLGFGILFGVMLVVNLRLAGVIIGVPLADVNRLLPWAMAGLAVNIVTGLLFFLAAPDQYTQNGAFMWKMGLVLLGGLSLLYPTMVEEETDATFDILRAAVTRKVMAGCSLAIWIGVIFFGRFLPYLGME
ncbi:MAG: hypothetical protein HY824_11695 [Acidobacteria bacterium]|nr:hypothetical protein [Acidobacteriota bacterium]